MDSSDRNKTLFEEMVAQQGDTKQGFKAESEALAQAFAPVATLNMDRILKLKEKLEAYHSAREVEHIGPVYKEERTVAQLNQMLVSSFGPAFGPQGPPRKPPEPQPAEDFLQSASRIKPIPFVAHMHQEILSGRIGVLACAELLESLWKQLEAARTPAFPNKSVEFVASKLQLDIERAFYYAGEKK